MCFDLQLGTLNARRRRAHGYSLDNQPFVMIHALDKFESDDISLRTCVDYS
jgi:hypothetical protein